MIYAPVWFAPFQSVQHEIPASISASVSRRHGKCIHMLPWKKTLPCSVTSASSTIKHKHIQISGPLWSIYLIAKIRYPTSRTSTDLHLCCKPYFGWKQQTLWDLGVFWNLGHTPQLSLFSWYDRLIRCRKPVQKNTIMTITCWPARRPGASAETAHHRPAVPLALDLPFLATKMAWDTPAKYVRVYYIVLLSLSL